MVSGTVDTVKDNLNWETELPNNAMWAIDALELDPENARKHSDENIRAIEHSLNRFGQQKPIVVTDKGLVKAGNGTVMAAKRLGWTKLWCRITDLPDEEADKYAIADNRAAELAIWDDDVLAAKLKSWPEADSGLFDALGFDENDVLEPDLSSLDVDVSTLDLGDEDPIGDTMILLRIQIPQRLEHSVTAQREIQAVCDKYGLILESRIQI
jgi:ParB-like chromosome segregation protein Spo0J